MFTSHADLPTQLTVDQREKYIDYWRMGRWSITFCFVIRVFPGLVVGNTKKHTEKWKLAKTLTPAYLSCVLFNHSFFPLPGAENYLIGSCPYPHSPPSPAPTRTLANRHPSTLTLSFGYT